MKIVKLKGGLGNQMFQYAFAKVLEKKTHDIVKLDLSEYENLSEDVVRKPRILNFNLSLDVATSEEISSQCLFKHNKKPQTNIYRIKIALEAFLNRKYYFEYKRSGCSLKDMDIHNFFDGYWQDWTMVDSVMLDLKEDFTPVSDISDISKEKLQQICTTNSVFLGVRRGDYLENVSHFGTFDQEYYNKAMSIVANRIDNPVFFIFSNDIGWVRENMDFSSYNTVFITDTGDDFEDYLLMSNCKSSIITNSTYYWWGARLKEYSNKIVVAPRNWFADGSPINIIPNRWITISN